jgi:hypothetical protein
MQYRGFDRCGAKRLILKLRACYAATTTTMSWYRKEQATVFDNVHMQGLEFLSGDVLADQFRQTWLRAKKYPLVQFPPGLTRELIAQPGGRAVHLFGGLAIAQSTNCDGAYLLGLGTAEE